MLQYNFKTIHNVNFMKYEQYFLVKRDLLMTCIDEAVKSLIIRFLLNFIVTLCLIYYFKHNIPTIIITMAICVLLFSISDIKKYCKQRKI